jgi:hypothetical protein
MRQPPSLPSTAASGDAAATLMPPDEAAAHPRRLAAHTCGWCGRPILPSSSRGDFRSGAHRPAGNERGSSPERPPPVWRLFGSSSDAWRSSGRPPPGARTGLGCSAPSLANSMTATSTTGTSCRCPLHSTRYSRRIASAPSSEARPMHNPAGVALRGREGDEACWATQPKPAPAAKRHPAEDRRSLHVPAPRVSLPRPGWRLLVKDAESLRPRCGTSCHPADPNRPALSPVTWRCSLGPRGSEG